MDDSLIIHGIVEDIVYQNPENGYTVFDFSMNDELFTGVGYIADAAAGELLDMEGRWESHPSYGRQFNVFHYSRSMPKTDADVLRYLSSGTIKGIGVKMALKIVQRFAERTFDVIENHPEELALISGISDSKAMAISREFKKKFATRELLIALEKFGMNAPESLAAHSVLKEHTVELIKANPYVLCSQEIGISFARADEIASNMDGDFLSYRLRAGIVNIVRHNLSNGHTCLPRRKVIPPACELLGANEETVDDTISDLIRDKNLCSDYIEDEEFVFIPEIYRAERKIADRFRVMLQYPPQIQSDADEEIEALQTRLNISFEEKQRLAIKIAVEKGLLVLTGGPGTGKTTTLNGIINLYEKRKLKVLLAAPTGRAAKRMSDVTGKEAKTIHRLLESSFGHNNRVIWGKNSQDPLDCDAIIIDELSMVDVTVFWGLLDALPLGCRIIMVGDSDQLPPVGAGNVLKDIIEANIVPVVALTEIFRQAKKSLIVTNAHKIVQGQNPILDKKDNDFFFIERNNVQSVRMLIEELYTSRLPHAYGYNPTEDIQIICSTKKGDLGTVKLNQSLQKIINPPAKSRPEHTSGGTTFRLYDKVMQTKNNYDLDWISTESGKPGQGVFNGDIGIIHEVNVKDRQLKIQFDERMVRYPFESLKELELAYAITVHKSQGCEFECVIMPVFNVNPLLAYRNLIYTAVTRAKTRIILAGSKRDIYQMVENNKKSKRYSALKWFLSNDNSTAY